MAISTISGRFARAQNGVLVDGTPVVIDLPTLGINGSASLVVEPVEGDSILIETSVDGGLNYVTYATVTEYTPISLTKGPNDSAFVNRVRLTRSAGSGTTSAYDIGRTVVVNQTTQGGLVLTISGASNSDGTAAEGDSLTVTLPQGVKGTIQMTRDGSAIGGAVSAAGSTTYAYTVVAADDGKAIGVEASSLVFYNTVNVAAGGDIVAPVRFSIAIKDTAPSVIELTYNELLTESPAPATSAFTVGGTLGTAKTVSSITITQNVVYLTCSSNFVSGDAPTLTYVVPGSDKVRDVAGNLAPAFSAIAVANGLPALADTGTINTRSLTVYGSGGGGFVQIITPIQYYGGVSESAFGSSSHYAKLAADTTGWIEMQCSDTNAAVRSIGIQNTGGSNHLTEMDYAIRFASSIAVPYSNGAALSSGHTFASPSSSCLVRLYRSATTGTVTAQFSEDSGTTWTIFHTFTTTTTELLFPHFYTSSQTIAIIGVKLQNFTDLGF